MRDQGAVGSVCDDQGDSRSLGAAQDRKAKGDGLGGVGRNIAHKQEKAVPAGEPPLVVNCGASVVQRDRLGSRLLRLVTVTVNWIRLTRLHRIRRRGQAHTKALRVTYMTLASLAWARIWPALLRNDAATTSGAWATCRGSGL